MVDERITLRKPLTNLLNHVLKDMFHAVLIKVEL